MPQQKCTTSNKNNSIIYLFIYLFLEGWQVYVGGIWHEGFGIWGVGGLLSRGYLSGVFCQGGGGVVWGAGGGGGPDTAYGLCFIVDSDTLTCLQQELEKNVAS